MLRTPLVALALAALLAAPATAQVDERQLQPADEATLRQRKEQALKKGCAWLISQQKPDGSWTYDNSPFTLAAQYYPMAPGVTGLSCFALLKCGVRPDDPAIQKAFAFMQGQELKHIYAVSCIVMACEARAAWEPPPEAGADAGRSTERKKQPRPQPGDLALARKCVDFIVGHQAPGGLWRYPQNNDEDVSNTQYAMLALDAAQRLGIDVPRATYEKCALRLIEAQEKDGPVVPAFSVPGAEKSFRELEKVRADMEKAIRALEKKFKKAPTQPDASGQTLEQATSTVEREASKKIIETAERRPPFKARGFAYIPPGAGNGADWASNVTGSMTASGLAAMFICKFHLEGGDKYERDLRPQLDAACRDAAAWLAHNFSVQRNPGFSIHHYYYLYGLERAGILGVIPKFGEHDWYQEGCDHLLMAQRGDGVWNVPNGTAGPVPDTCFALLFLARGTTPVVEIPQRVATGSGFADPAQGSTPRPPAPTPATPPR